MKLGKRIMKRTASIAAKLLFVTVFTKAVKHGIIKGAKKLSGTFKGAKKRAQ